MKLINPGLMRKLVAGPGGEGLRVKDRAVADAVLDFGFGKNDGIDVLVRVLVLSVRRLGKFREVDVDALLAVAGRADDRREELDGRHLVAGFFRRFAFRAFNWILARFESARNHLDERFLCRFAVLLHEHELAVRPPRENGDCVSMPNHLALRLASVRQFNVEQIDADDLPRVLPLRTERLFCEVFHMSIRECPINACIILVIMHFSRVLLRLNNAWHIPFYYEESAQSIPACHLTTVVAGAGAPSR